MAKIIEAKAVISGEDKTGAMFAGLSKKFDGIAKNAKALENLKPMGGWGSGFQKEIDKLQMSSKQLQAIQRDFEKAQITAPRFKASAYYEEMSRWKSKTLQTLRDVKIAEEESAKRSAGMRGMVRRGVQFGAGALGVYGGAHLAQTTARTALQKSGEAQRETTRQYLAGMTPAEEKEAAEKARALSTKYPSIGPVAIQEHIRQLRSRFGDFHHAMDAVEDLTKAQVVLGTHAGGQNAGHDLERLVLGLEGLGAGADPEKFRTYLSAFVKAKSLFPDLRGEDFRQYLTTAKASKYGLSEDYLKSVVPTMMQHEGASNFGTMQATAFSSLVGARTTPRAAEKLFDLGLIDKDQLIVDSKGKIKGFNKIRDENLLVSDPFKFATDVLEPALGKKGIGIDKNKEEFVATVTKAFSNRNAGEFFTSLLVNQGVIRKDRDMLHSAQGIDAATEVPLRDPFVAATGVREQVYAFMQTVGGPMAEKAAAGLNTLAQSIGSVTASLSTDKGLQSDIATTGLITALGTTAGGAAWLAKVLPKGTVTGALGSAGAGAVAAGSGLAFMLAWHAAGAAKREELVAEYKKLHPEIAAGGATPPNPGADAADKLRAIDRREAGLNLSGLGGAFGEAQRKRIQAARDQLEPSLQEAGFGPSFIPGRGQTLSIESIRNAVGMGASGSPITVSGEVRGETTVKVEVTASGELLRVVEGAKTGRAPLSGTVSSNGPGSLGTSSPDAAASPIGGP